MKTVSAIFFFLVCVLPCYATESEYIDLPPLSQVSEAINNHINVLNAVTGIKIEQGNQRKWQSGNYEFNVRAGTAKRRIGLPDQVMNEWDVTIERPLRLPNKILIDDNIGDEVVNRAEQALGDAYHETGRLLLHLWFNWQREQAQANQWQQQVDILKQQASTTEKRFQAGDAPKMELNQAQAAVSQASVGLQQAKLRTQLVGAELTRQFPSINLTPNQLFSMPILIEHDFNYWKEQILDHNHEIELAQSEKRIQQMLAKRSMADRIPDPTVGLRYSNEMGGNEKVTGLYFSIPISFGLRNANSQHEEYLAEIANNREVATRRRLEVDAYAAHTQAINSYETWKQAQHAADSMRKNAELVTRAYTLGESSLLDTLTARRLALEATLTENVAQLDANETRYRLLLDAHQFWQIDGHDLRSVLNE
jgi:outer membrane protein TolC